MSIRQHVSAYFARQHTSAYVSIRRQHTSAYVSIRQHTSEHKGGGHAGVWRGGGGGGGDVRTQLERVVSSLLSYSQKPLKVLAAAC